MVILALPKNWRLKISLLLAYGSKSTKKSDKGSFVSLCFIFIIFRTVWPSFCSSSLMSSRGTE